jgi:hypothetical protein
MPRPRPTATVTAIETSVIIGNATNMGLRVGAEPEKKAAAMIPSVATDTTTGSNLGDLGGGRPGGASTAMSTVVTAGGSRRTAGTKH